MQVNDQKSRGLDFDVDLMLSINETVYTFGSSNAVFMDRLNDFPTSRFSLLYQYR